jgi:hypothetical protein
MATININVILVGSELFTTADRQEVNDAITRTRTLFAAIGLSVGQVLNWIIPVGSARGRQDIDSDSEAETLTDEWTVNNNGLDLFFVRTYAGTTVGLSRVDGPCDKNAKGMDGSVVAVESSPNTTGFATAHELAHYLGLSHVNNSANLMNPTVPNGGALTTSQGNNMKDHCFVF